MNKIRFNIPEGHIPLDIKEYSDEEGYYIEVDLIEKNKMCDIKYPHYGIDCPCNEK